MKNLWKVLAVLLCLTVLITLLGPQILLKSAMQPAVETEYAYSEAFCTTYEQVRERLQQRVQHLQTAGVTTEQESYPVDAEDDLYIDTLYLPSNGEKTNLVVLTTGVHGMEGYIGSVMLDVFFEEVYPTLDLEDTGVLVVANVNPYGMKYYRRYNENNVDLNRNFILDWTQFDRATNQDYPKVVEFLGPTGQIGNALWHEAGFWLKLGKEAVTTGADTISNALLGGQYEYPQGVY